MDSFTAFADLTAEVEIPKDGTLSRVLYRDDRIRMVAFGFDTDQELTEHTAGSPAIVQVVTGRIALTLDGRTLDVGPGSWVHMAAGLAHSLVAVEPTVMLLTMIKNPPAGT